MKTFADLKELSTNENFKKLLDELKVKGLDDILSIRLDSKNYIKLFLKVIIFFDNNKNCFKNIDSETKEDILILCIDEILDRNGIDIDEEEIEENLQLLKSSFIVQEGFEFIYDILSSFFRNVYSWVKSKLKKNKK
mgnify:FL=1